MCLIIESRLLQVAIHLWFSCWPEEFASSGLRQPGMKETSTVPRFIPRNRQQDNTHTFPRSLGLQSEVCANLTRTTCFPSEVIQFIHQYIFRSIQIITTQRLKPEHFLCESCQYPWQLIRFLKTGLRHLGEDLVKDLRSRWRLLHTAAGQIKGPRKHPILSLSWSFHKGALSAEKFLSCRPPDWWFMMILSPSLWHFLCASCIKLYLHTCFFTPTLLQRYANTEKAAKSKIITCETYKLILTLASLIGWFSLPRNVALYCVFQLFLSLFSASFLDFFVPCPFTLSNCLSPWFPIFSTIVWVTIRIRDK